MGQPRDQAGDPWRDDGFVTMALVATRAGNRLFQTVSGPDTGRPIIFSNSLGTTHRMWDAVTALLVEEHRCIRYDTRGHGASTHDGQPFEIEDLAEDVIDLLDALDLERVHFVGLSLGGMTGQALALRHPDRLTGMTLIATSPCMPPRENWEARAALVRDKGMASIVPATLERWFTEAFRSDPAAVATAATLLAIDPYGYAACCEAIGRMDFRPVLGGIAIPTSVIAGVEDPATPLPMLQDLHLAIAGSRFVEISPGSHLVAIEQPERVAAAIARGVTG